MAAQDLTARETLLAFTGLAIALLLPMYGTGFYAAQFREGELIASWRVGIFFSVLWGVVIFVFFRKRIVFLKTADRVFLTSGVVVALTTACFPHVTGYGTNLFQL